MSMSITPMSLARAASLNGPGPVIHYSHDLQRSDEDGPPAGGKAVCVQDMGAFSATVTDGPGLDIDVN